MSPALPSFAVLQMGARLHYAVPAVLQRRGMLACFATDATSPPPGVRNLLGALPSGLKPPALRRLLDRNLPAELLGARLLTAPAHAVAERLKLGAGLAHAHLRTRLLEEGFGGANALYILDGSDLPLAREARARGMFVVYEQICDPRIGRYVAAERAAHPGVEPQDSEAEIEGGIARDRQVWSEAHLVIAPSELVKAGIAELGGPADRVEIIHYGIDRHWLDHEATFAQPRALFVGRASLAKGAHHFAAVARQLRGEGVSAEFRGVGAVSASSAASPLFAGVDWAGIVPRSEMAREYERASVMVLPTASDGFALAILEAMACGVPVVTTDRCGSVVRDGVDGFIVRHGDTAALVASVRRLLTDATLRAELARNAKARASGFTWEQFSAHLTKALADGFARSKGAVQ